MATLHTDFSTSVIDENKLSVFDKKICSYIEKYGDIVYDPIIADETDWQIFYNLTELRKGILSWYDFSADARVLEIGAAFGTLTGCLCRKCGHVTATDRSLYRAKAIAARYKNLDNLDIYAGDVAEIEFPEAFDYIILIGLLERAGNGSTDLKPYADYLSSMKKWLKPGGKLLLAVENRFGLRYFCGEAEPHTRRAFDGINHYPRGTRGYSFSRKEIENVVNVAGFGYHRFYYPLPDYKLPQLIYTDAWLPGKNIGERLIPYYRSGDTLVASERELYGDIIENGVFPFFANSFLVECCVEKILGETERILYAAVSTDRGEERGFATVIRANGTVQKMPLYEKGRNSAREACRNILDLQAHGIPVVEHRLLPGDILELPFISWPTLSDYIKEVMRSDTGKFLYIMDRIYQNILMSSEQVPEEKNELPAVLGLCASGSYPERTEDGNQTQDNQENLLKTPERFGPIMKKAYMELIPLNCFYNPQTGDFLYFDQEFVRENYPAKYVLFRAINYIYGFFPDAERHYPRQRLLRKYEMEDTWEIYLKEERRFLDEVRKRQQYRQFYRWTQTDRGRMLENVRKLGT